MRSITTFLSQQTVHGSVNLISVYSAEHYRDKLSVVGIFGKDDQAGSSLVRGTRLASYYLDAGRRIHIPHQVIVGGWNFNRPDLITIATASSESIVPLVAQQCGISESQVVPIGMPRTDAYFRKKRKKSSGRNYLYAPTFRAGNWSPNWGELQRWLNDDEKFIVKPHVVTKHLLPEPTKNIVEAGSGIPSTDFLVQADVLVTDFSSIMFDAYVMRKPVVLFAKDRYRYLETRGMYRTYPAMYSDCFCDNEQELTERLRDVQWTEHMEHLREHHAGACDGHSVERCIDLIRSLI